MAKKSAKQIVEESLPDLEVVETPASPVTPDQARAGTRPGPSIADLKRKFLGTDAASDAEEEAAAADAGESNVKVVQVRGKKPVADPVDDPGNRTLIVDDQGPVGGRG